LFDAEKVGGLLCRQHGRAAFRADDLSGGRGLTNNVAAISSNQHFKFTLDFYCVSA